VTRALHVLEIVADEAALQAVAHSIAALEALCVRVSALCGSDAHAALLERGPGRAVLVGELGDDPCWATIRLLATWSRDEGVDVFHAHGSAAHVVGVLAGALCDVSCVAEVDGAEIPMLDLEAHRLGEHAHLHVRQGAALHHARALGLAPARVHRLHDDHAASLRDMLAKCARTADAAQEPLRRG
jgi:hypothetical protein